jgi:hypothetical protein
MMVEVLRLANVVKRKALHDSSTVQTNQFWIGFQKSIACGNLGEAGGAHGKTAVSERK